MLLNIRILTDILNSALYFVLIFYKNMHLQKSTTSKVHIILYTALKLENY